MYFTRGINDWLDKEIIIKVKISTYDSYKYRVSKYLCPYFGDEEIEQITSDDIQYFVSNLKGYRNETCLSPNTVNGIFVILSEFFKYCVGNGMLRNNPCLNVVLPKRRRGKVVALSIDEQRLILKYISNHNQSKSCLIAIALLTGMRLGELCSLKWENVDLKNKLIYVKNTNRRVYTETNKTVVITTSPKTEDSIRIIPISSFVEEWLMKLIPLGSDYVFSKRNGTGYDNRSIQKYFKQLIDKIGITNKNFHTLRHTFATRAVESNMDIKTLSMILGHSSVTITMNLYVHPNVVHTKMAMERLSAYIIE